MRITAGPQSDFQIRRLFGKSQQAANIGVILALRGFCRETALPVNTMDRGNNWSNWGLVLVLA